MAIKTFIPKSSQGLVVYLTNTLEMITCAKFQSTCFTVMRVYASFWNHQTGQSFPSQTTVAELSGVSVKTVFRCVKHLEEAGVLNVSRRKNCTNIITFNFRKLRDFLQAAFDKHNSTAKKSRHEKYKKARRFTPATFQEFIKKCAQMCADSVAKTHFKKGYEVAREGIEKKRSASKRQHSHYAKKEPSKQEIETINRAREEELNKQAKASAQQDAEWKAKSTSPQDALKRIESIRKLAGFRVRK